MNDRQPIDFVPVELATAADAKYTSVAAALPPPKWMLLSEWIAYFLTAQVPTVSSTGIGNKNPEGGATWRCATADNTVEVEFDDLPASGTQRVTTRGITQESHTRLVHHATSYAEGGRTRQVHWHATFSSKEFDPFIPSTALHFMRGLDHARRLAGRVGFGPTVLIDFAAPTDAKPLQFSPVQAKVYFLLDGAYPGPYTSQIAKAWIPNVRACVSFCLGETLHIGKFRPLSNDEEAGLLETLRTDPVEQQLAIEHLPLGNVLHTFAMVGALEATHKLLRAIACFETAIQQGNEAATTIHLVSAVEALARPNYKKAWNNRVTQRYHEFLHRCIPDKLSEIMAHANLRSAFPKVHSKEQLVGAIYGARSSAVHNGHAGEFHEFFGGDEAMRVMFLADIVRAAIIEFAKQPFTSLVGHPAVDKDITVKLDNNALAVFRERADEKSVSVEDYIASLASMGP